jgi:hypothetical protein
MTRTQFLTAAAVGIVGFAEIRPASAELVIEIVTPETETSAGFHVAVKKLESGMLSFYLDHDLTKNLNMRLTLGPYDSPMLVCSLEPKEGMLRTRRGMMYRFDISEKALANASLEATDDAPKQLGGTLYRFDLMSFVDAKPLKG